MLKKPFAVLYFLAALGCLLGRLLESPLAEQLDYLFKPWLMPLLALHLSTSLRGNWEGRHLHLLIALIFAWGGDIALMLGEGIYFLLGLSSFLLMQILYITLFFNQNID